MSGASGASTRTRPAPSAASSCVDDGLDRGRGHASGAMRCLARLPSASSSLSWMPSKPPFDIMTTRSPRRGLARHGVDDLGGRRGMRARARPADEVGDHLLRRQPLVLGDCARGTPARPPPRRRRSNASTKSSWNTCRHDDAERGSKIAQMRRSGCARRSAGDAFRQSRSDDARSRRRPDAVDAAAQLQAALDADEASGPRRSAGCRGRASRRPRSPRARCARCARRAAASRTCRTACRACATLNRRRRRGPTVDIASPASRLAVDRRTSRPAGACAPPSARARAGCRRRAAAGRCAAPARPAA